MAVTYYTFADFGFCCFGYNFTIVKGQSWLKEEGLMSEVAKPLEFNFGLLKQAQINMNSICYS